MKTLRRIENYYAAPEEVFQCLDDLSVTGMHMTRSSMPMMGGKLKLEFLTEHKTGLGSRYRWKGKILGMLLDFTVAVTRWVPNKEKVWETVGDPSIIIYSWFRMTLKIFRGDEGARAELSFSYKEPERWLYKIFCSLMGNWYGRWCLKHMLIDCKEILLLEKRAKDVTDVTKETVNWKP